MFIRQTDELNQQNKIEVDFVANIGLKKILYVEPDITIWELNNKFQQTIQPGLEGLEPQEDWETMYMDLLEQYNELAERYNALIRGELPETTTVSSSSAASASSAAE